MPANGRSSGPPLSHVLQLRLSDVQRRYLLYLAARDGVGMAEACRQLLERSLDRQARVPIEGNAPGDRGLSLRMLLSAATEDGITELVDRARGDASP